MCGPLPILSAAGNKYIITLIYDYSRMFWVYLLKNKSKYFAKFKEFHVKIKKEANAHIGTLHSNNGGEYTLVDFKNYISQHGIKHQTIVLYNP